MTKPKDIIERAESEAVETIATALMDLYRACGLKPWRVEIHPEHGEEDLEGFHVIIRSNRNGI